MVDINTNEQELNAQLQARFNDLPKVVQDSITSADVQEHLRKLADTHKLHLDQWQRLENEVMLTLLGFQPVEDLQQNLVHDVGVDGEVAKALAADISAIVFVPIREELERELAHTGTQPATAEATQPAAGEKVAPATPPPERGTDRAVRPLPTESYKSGEKSSERKEVHADPYREPPL
ncbi:MAG TPA: hypothetical protein VJL39_02335 [Candidatus Paceibacterota bacterium]